MEVGGLPIEEVRVDTVEMVFDLCGSPTVLGLSIRAKKTLSTHKESYIAATQIVLSVVDDLREGGFAGLACLMRHGCWGFWGGSGRIGRKGTSGMVERKLWQLGF